MDDTLKDPLEEEKDELSHEEETDESLQEELKKLIELNDLRAGALRKMISKIGTLKSSKPNADK